MTQPNDSPTAALVAAGVVHLVPDSPITFASGLVSPVYMDVRQLLAQPKHWKQVITALSQAVKTKQPQVVAGVAVGGIPHSTAVAMELNLPSCFIRLTQKSHGRGRSIEGADVEGKRVVLVEDVVTTGGSSLGAIQLLEQSGADVAGCVSIAGYGFAAAAEAFSDTGVDLQVLAPFREVLAAASRNPKFAKSALEEALRWHEDPQGWNTQDRPQNSDLAPGGLARDAEVGWSAQNQPHNSDPQAQS